MPNISAIPPATTATGSRPPTFRRRLARRRAVLGAVAATLTASCAAAPGTRPTDAPATGPVVHVGSVPLGVYAGPGDPSGVANFAAQTGSAPSLASDYLPRGDGWSGMTNVKPLRRYLGPWGNSGYRLVLGVPMIPTDRDGQPEGTLAHGAEGLYDGHFATLAHTLVSYGLGDAVLRLGWEFNANWYPWAVSDSSDAAAFAAYFRAVVTTMRAVDGAHFRFVWNPNPGSTGFWLSSAYPGNAYVDYIGIDLYDQVWGVPEDPQDAWPFYLDEYAGLRWLAQFAASHGKPVAIPEWGVAIRSDGHGLGDDPTFVAHLAQWISTHDVAFTSYFDYDASDGSHDLLDGRFPQSLVAFRETFRAPAPARLATGSSSTTTGRDRSDRS
jgi:hypothetical protein